jgi:flagellar protein FliS
MNPRQPELNYQNAAVQSAGPIGLVILLYDRMVSDLKAAVEAIRSNDVEARCRAANHAFQVLQQLEGSLDTANGGETARSLSKVYSHMRAKLLEAQIRLDPGILTRQINTLLQLREAWNRADSPTAAAPASAEAHPPADAAAGEGLAGVPPAIYGGLGEEQATSSWSA